VTTHAILFLEDLDPESSGDACAHATHYEAVPVSAFAALMKRLPPQAIANSTFVDAGAGMGRAMMLASEYPFKQVVGIEISPALYEVARENLRARHDFVTQCNDVRLVRGDARRYRYPRGNVVLFLYNPFDEYALDATLARIGERTDRDVWLLYHTPVHDGVPIARGYDLVSRGREGDVYLHRGTTVLIE